MDRFHRSELAASCCTLPEPSYSKRYHLALKKSRDKKHVQYDRLINFSLINNNINLKRGLFNITMICHKSSINIPLSCRIRVQIPQIRAIFSWTIS
ncbi:Ovule protein [Caenorhabditis elegans]|uniref:Ovule protein n=1 Tax=Caenorhabditis elegans TaxID=6239 RepID=A0A0S4XRL7_CAEEL|nr:Ovule protein [Caenorhabditis elegans]CUV67095.1 Ovule protein [Caenorhabditis elegans]|eukprot:NP_001305242.1 Uncharacterized protein CELE_Y39F10A.6 [Caenorhabditis elegans]